MVKHGYGFWTRKNKEISELIANEKSYESVESFAQFFVQQEFEGLVLAESEVNFYFRMLRTLKNEIMRNKFGFSEFQVKLFIDQETVIPGMFSIISNTQKDTQSLFLSFLHI